MISKAGLGSRTEARSWIHARRVSVNGKVIENPDAWVDPQHDRILFDGKALVAAEKRYVVLYKPTGYVTTYKDPEGRKTVYDLLLGIDGFLANAGRLDLDTSGLIIFSNDTDFVDYLTSPEHHVPKTYLVKTSTKLDDAAIVQLTQGVVLSDGPTRPAIVKKMRETATRTFLEITITEGRNRQVRRMIEAVGSKVAKLVRTHIGPLSIGSLEIGKWRDLTAEEIRALGYRSLGKRQVR